MKYFAASDSKGLCVEDASKKKCAIITMNEWMSEWGVNWREKGEGGRCLDNEQAVKPGNGNDLAH